MTRPYWTKDDYLDKLRSLTRLGRIMWPQDFDGDPEEITDFEIETTLSLLEYISEQKPSLLLKEIKDNILAFPHMLSIYLAMLTARGDENFLLSSEVKHNIYIALSVLDPDQLLEFVEYLKSKTLGRGFGSRPQKILKKVMEDWDEETIENNIYNFEYEMKMLVQLVHPKYIGYKGNLIKILLDKF